MGSARAMPSREEDMRAFSTSVAVSNFYDVKQNRECKKNMLCKVSFSNSLCSRTV